MSEEHRMIKHNNSRSRYNNDDEDRHASQHTSQRASTSYITYYRDVGVTSVIMASVWQIAYHHRNNISTLMTALLTLVIGTDRIKDVTSEQLTATFVNFVDLFYKRDGTIFSYFANIVDKSDLHQDYLSLILSSYWITFLLLLTAYIIRNFVVRHTVSILYAASLNLRFAEAFFRLFIIVVLAQHFSPW